MVKSDQTFDPESGHQRSVPRPAVSAKSIQIQMTDFPEGASVNSVTIAKVRLVPSAPASATMPMTTPGHDGEGCSDHHTQQCATRTVERLEHSRPGSGDGEVKANFQGNHVPARVFRLRRGRQRHRLDISGSAWSGSGFSTGAGLPSAALTLDGDGFSGAEARLNR